MIPRPPSSTRTDTPFPYTTLVRSPEVTLSWHPIDDTLVYAAYKTGYKSGGFSVPGNLSITATADSLRVESEKAKGGEFGIKSQLLDRTLLLQLTTYLRSEEHTSELQSLMRISYAVFCLKKKKTNNHTTHREH